ncbi:hypothetical protein BDQ17DRAFT_1414773 [Cyathus striatus]|nr:hypothetical protein BDQ17DRAFT_1414773 [Cyathus striatus]
MPYFRENLRPEKNYLTAWGGGGFSAQQPFRCVLYFGDIFNLTHLRSALQKPILEWREVKKLPPLEDPYSSIRKEHIGCWSTTNIEHTSPFENWNMLNHLGLDISYTRVPKQVRQKEDENDFHVIFSEFAALTYPGGPSSNPTDFLLMIPSPMDSKLPPDQHLACLDWSPVWNIIGKNLPFTERMMSLGKEYLTILFQVSPIDIPRFIAVHVRRGDFTRIFSDNECLDLPEYQYKYREFKKSHYKSMVLPFTML